MDKKEVIRKKFFLKRKRKYFEIDENFFIPLINLIKNRKFIKSLSISLYYPSSYEVNVFKILDLEFFKKFIYFLPSIEKKNSMNFYEWKKHDILTLNKYGVPEPMKLKKKIPSIILVPLLAFDKNKNRIGYGKGFYDKYLNKYLKGHKKILTVGVAFSFQKYHKIPVNKNDYRLDYIITEKGIIK